MRGVYWASYSVRLAATGSSPHARGLPGAVGVAAVVDGIIPACAGFTHWCAGERIRDTDHPRMRGVYFDVTALALRHPGSSPHARGLPLHVRLGPRLDGIIPACAGFTDS